MIKGDMPEQAISRVLFPP